MIRFLTGGESHGPGLTAILDGIPAGLALSEADIDRDLIRRQAGHGRGARMEMETDRVQILGGVIGGRTIGAPIVLRIANRDWENWQEKWSSGLPPLTVPRPGHADYAGMRKLGIRDARMILERASARETAARVAVGAVARKLLCAFGISLGSVVERIGDVEAHLEEDDLALMWARAEESPVRCPVPSAAQWMMDAIDAARSRGDSLGGIFVVGALAVPAGIGSHRHWDCRLDARLAAAVMSIPAVKGVEIGSGFANACLPGTQVHDGFSIDEEGRIGRRANRAGGVEGGISNGEPILVRAAMKPIPTTVSPQPSVDVVDGAPSATEYQRSDVCAVPAAAVVGEAMVAWVLADGLLEKAGGDSIEEMLAHWRAGGVDVWRG